MSGHASGWVIKSRNKTQGIWKEELPTYFADRCGIKSPRFLTNIHYRVKWFSKKRDAETYFYKKINAGFDLSECDVKRKKLFLDKDGEYDYWKNRSSLMGLRGQK